MRHNFAHVCSRLFNTPLMLRPEKAEMLVAALADRIGIAKFDRIGAEAMTAVELNEKAASATEGDRRPRRDYEMIDGIAYIPVDGTLVHKLGSVDAYSGMVGYDGIITKVRQARADAKEGTVRGIIINYHTPGGEVFGCFDAADEIAAGNARNGGGVPVWSIVNDEACSAGYALACAGDKVFGTQTSVSGSIGAYMLYVDWTKALADEGISVTFFREYDLKARGSGLEEMDEETAAKFQASVAQTVDMFARHVAANRRVLTLKAIADMRSQWFDASQAASLGLIDDIMPEIEVFAKFQRSLARRG